MQQGTDYHTVYSNFFLSFWTNDVDDFPKGYLNNFSTELSSQIFDCCPRNFLIQEERISNVVSTSHWIWPVYLLLSANEVVRRSCFQSCVSFSLFAHGGIHYPWCKRPHYAGALPDMFKLIQLYRGHPGTVGKWALRILMKCLLVESKIEEKVFNSME